MSGISIRKNYIYNTLYQILSLITPLITAPYASRIFGADGTGIQSYTNSINSYFLLFAMLGVETYGQREIARHRDDKEASSRIFWEIVLMTFITTGICMVGWGMLICLAEEYTMYYAVLTITLLAEPFNISWFFGGQEQFKYVVLRNTFFRLAGIAVLFLFVREKNDLLLYMGLLASAGFLGNLSMWTYLPQFLVKVNVRELNIKRHFRETVIYFIPTVATSVYTVLDKTMIGVLTESETENGYYEQATKIVNIAKAMIFSLNTVMSARMSYLFSVNRTEEIKAKLNKSFSFLMLAGIPMTLGIIGIAENFVPWFFGDGYEKTIRLLWVLSPLIVVISISNCLGGQYLTPSGQRARSTKGILAGAGINFLLNLLLIPWLASVGAAIASVAAEMVISTVYVHMSKGYADWKMIWKNMWKRLIAGSVMLFVVLLIARGHSGVVWITMVQVCVGGGIYFIMLYLEKDHLIIELLEEIREKIRKKS